MQVTAKQLAEMLDGFSTDDKFTTHVLKLAKSNNLVIVTAIGIDCVQFNGAISDEADCYKGGDLFIDKESVYIRQDKDKSRKLITAFWEKNRIYTWKFITKIPHAKFSMLQDGKKWCEAIIYCIDDICP